MAPRLLNYLVSLDRSRMNQSQFIKTKVMSRFQTNQQGDQFNVIDYFKLITLTLLPQKLNVFSIYTVVVTTKRQMWKTNMIRSWARASLWNKI